MTLAAVLTELETHDLMSSTPSPFGFLPFEAWYDLTSIQGYTTFGCLFASEGKAFEYTFEVNREFDRMISA